MPLFIAALIVMALFYQMFFRYETHENDKKPGTMIERDTLTGDEHVLKAGAKISVIGRLLGNPDDNANDGNSKMLQPWGVDPDSNPTTSGSDVDSPETPGANLDLNDHQQVEKASRPVPVPREVVVASSAPPVPVASNVEEPTLAAESAKPFAIRQVDLNKDGSTEEIIQNADKSDGMLDISIVKNGREIFFGRGQQISLLPSSNQGWSDIVLKMGAKTLQVFRYDPKDAAYRALDHKS